MTDSSKSCLMKSLENKESRNADTLQELPKRKFPINKPLKRGRSLIGPSPDCRFGPKALTVEHTSQQYEIDPYDQKLKWSRPPETVLVIKKIDADVNKSFKALASWLIVEKHLTVFVEEKLLQNVSLKSDASFEAVYKQLKTSFRSDQIDLIICLGGDGTLLYAASLFQQSMPPVVAFSSGSLGFLTAHKFANYRDTINQILTGNIVLMLRSRLRCEVWREKQRELNGVTEDGDRGLDVNANDNSPGEEHCSYLVLNEVVVDRGNSHFLCNIDLYLEGRRITSVQGDGLIISTPTGSTAYAVAAGASMVHPNVPSIMITPICPHSLSFRPIIVPPGAELKFTVSESARGTASVCFDGRTSITITKGDYVIVRTSVHPAPCVCKDNPFDDWFTSLSECLHWNSRQEQKHFVSEESD